MTDPINRCRVKKGFRQEEQEFVETILKIPNIEPKPEACDDCCDCYHVYDDQHEA